MKVHGTPYRTIWLADNQKTVRVIDQTKLPFQFKTVDLASVDEAAHAIKTMVVRGAPLIGATAAYGMALAMRADSSTANIAESYQKLLATRPTAVNLAWALNKLRDALTPLAPANRIDAAFAMAAEICDEDVRSCASIGDHGETIIRQIHNQVHRRVNVLTHCNAGWLATVDWGTALAPIYKAFDNGIDIHVWVDETRPRNQGASLTAWELQMHGVPCTLIADNAGGHLMQHGQVDLCIVGTDRTTATGDVCNKVGTYLKALAAHACKVPFYVAAPSSSIDWRLSDGVKEIPIEERDPREITHMVGVDLDGRGGEFRIVGEGTAALNVAFDVTPSQYVTRLITERGICAATRTGLKSLFPEFV
jgi:methylthioribose-1-phosphate isomerase